MKKNNHNNNNNNHRTAGRKYKPAPPPAAGSTSNLRLYSCWSKAGIGSSVVLEFKSSKAHRLPRIVLDLGATPSYGETLSAGVVLLTHAHIDHVGAVFAHARAYSLGGGLVATYYAPKEAVPLLEQACQAMDALDALSYDDSEAATTTTMQSKQKQPLRMKFVPVEPGEEFTLPITRGMDGCQIMVRAFRTTHGACPSVGYTIGVRGRAQRKPEYQDLSQDELRTLAKQGTQLSFREETWELTYTGDTTVDAFSIPDNSPLFQVQVLITEATMLEDSDKARRSAGENSHMHVDHVVDSVMPRTRAEIVLVHVSARYSAKQTMNLISSKVNEEDKHRVSVAVSSLTGARRDFGRSILPNGLMPLSSMTRR